jgi:hypothetical protein
MYADDNHDSVPPNRSALVNDVWRSSPASWIGDSSAPYDTSFSNIENGLLFKYDYNRSLATYHCPCDRSHARQPLRSVCIRCSAAAGSHR